MLLTTSADENKDITQGDNKLKFALSYLHNYLMSSNELNNPFVGSLTRLLREGATICSGDSLHKISYNGIWLPSGTAHRFLLQKSMEKVCGNVVEANGA